LLNRRLRHFPFSTEVGTDPESGLDYAGARFYSPMSGRFLSADPVVGVSEDPESLGRYSYVENDPINHVDPAGTTPQCWTKVLWKVTTYYDSVTGLIINQTKKLISKTKHCLPQSSADFCNSGPYGAWTWVEGTAESAGLTALWADGFGPDSYRFGADSPMTQLMMTDPAIQNGINAYTAQNAGCKNRAQFKPLVREPEKFGLRGLAGAGFNPARQFVGSYNLSIYPNGPDSILIRLWNTTSVTSLLYGVGPNWGRHAIGPFGLPGGNMVQTYTWTQPYP
jgi:RHS repeat-associated protein